MKLLKIAGVFTLLAVNLNLSGQDLPYKNKKLPVEERVQDLLSRMTLDEKIGQITMNNRVLQLQLDEKGRVTSSSLDALFGGISVGCVESPLVTSEQVAVYSEAMDKYMREKTRLGIPVIQTGECLHGYMAHEATIYPQAVAQGATWNPGLIKEMASMIAEEASYSGVDQALSPLFDLARDPRWGRAEECYGEDPYHVKTMGVAFVNGLQGESAESEIGIKKGKLAATSKHYVAYSVADGGLNLGPATVDERTLRDIHLYPFEGAVKEANIYSLMPGYHEINGIPIHADSFLMKDVLRDEWGFKGYVISDAVAINMMEFFHKTAKDRADAAYQAITSGINLEMPDNYNYSTLKEQVESGKLDIAVVDEAVEFVLRVKFKMGLFDNPYSKPRNFKKLVHTKENIAMAQKVAEESMVLLKNNNGILPLNKDKIKSIAVIGPNADRVQFGDASVSKDSRYGTTLLEGLKAYLDDDVKINYAEGCDVTNLSKDGFDAAVKAANESDIIVLALGGSSIIYSSIPNKEEASSRPNTSGEGCDRHELNFPGVQPELLELIAKQNKPVILVMINGRALTVGKEIGMVDAALEAWYPGEKGGEAITRVLFGEVNPSGKLPVSFPQSTGHIPTVSNYKPSGRGFYKSPGAPDRPGRDYVFSSPAPLFCFGYGLSYTTFEYSNIKVENLLESKDVVRVSFTIKNSGDRAGAEVAQIYVRDEVSSVSTPVRDLKAFEKVYLEPQEQKDLVLEIKKDDLKLWNKSMEYVLEPGKFTIYVGSSSEDERLKQSFEVAEK